MEINKYSLPGFDVMSDIGFLVRDVPKPEAQKCQLYLKLLLNPLFARENKLFSFNKNQQKECSFLSPTLTTRI